MQKVTYSPFNSINCNKYNISKKCTPNPQTNCTNVQNSINFTADYNKMLVKQTPRLKFFNELSSLRVQNNKPLYTISECYDIVKNTPEENIEFAKNAIKAFNGDGQCNCSSEKLIELVNYVRDYNMDFAFDLINSKDVNGFRRFNPDQVIDYLSLADNKTSSLVYELYKAQDVYGYPLHSPIEIYDIVKYLEED